MKSRFVLFALMFLLSTICMIAAQASDDLVDVKETNARIRQLQTENDYHQATIAANQERKAFLDERVQASETRLAKIAENLEYAQETNLELNAINRETKDKETKKRLKESRDELMSVMWILKNEKIFLTEQTEEDKEEIEFLAKDNARRNSLVETNEVEIAVLQEAVSNTESKINDVSNKLDTLIAKLDGLREEVTTD